MINGASVIFNPYGQRVASVKQNKVKRHILESRRFTPITDSCDVAVVGGGIAGVAVALAASRNGMIISVP